MPSPDMLRTGPAETGTGPRNDHAGEHDGPKIGQKGESDQRLKRRHGLSKAEQPWRLTRDKAERLAAKIYNYWIARGIDVDVEIVPISGGINPEFSIRSNLRFGCRP